VHKKRTILVAFFVLLAALVFAGTALSQALVVGTDGQAGDNSLRVEPLTASQESGDTNVALSAGKGDGSAATVGAQKDTDGADALVGCIDASVANGNDGGSASVGNCGGSGSAASGGLDNGTAGGGGGAELGCIVAAVFGFSSGGAQLGSCAGAESGGSGDDEEGGTAGDISGNDDGASAGAAGDISGDGGAAGAEAGVAGEEGGAGPGDGQGGGDEPCATLEQAAALTGSGALPFWALGVAAIAAFGLGTVFARRRTKEVDPTG
jgi:hypothetical protein